MKKKRIIVNQKEQVISGIIIILNMKVMVIEIRKILPEEHFNKTKPYLIDIVIDLEESDTWNNFISSKDTEEEHVMHLKSSNIKIESYSDRN